VKTRRLRRGRRSHALLWLRQGDRLWLVQRPERGVWAGLWSLPEFDSRRGPAGALVALAGQGEWLPPPSQHVLTHFDWTLQPLRWTLPAGGRAACWTGRWLRGHAGAGPLATRATRRWRLGLPAAGIHRKLA
jgi:A/G-specific adenine glycosylase